MPTRAFLVAGLGNPGPDYSRTRHNIGFMVADEVARRSGSSFSDFRGIGLVAPARLGMSEGGMPGPRAVLVKPLTFMNLSGGPVSSVAGYYGIEPEDVIVIHDDMDLEFGMVRLKRGGGEGGHNGLRDVSKALGTRDYLRVRCGIGRPPGRLKPATYVLNPFPKVAGEKVAALIEDAADAARMLALQGLEATQLEYHSR